MHGGFYLKVLASGVKDTHTPAQHKNNTLPLKPNFVPEDPLMRAGRQPENVNPLNESSTPAKIDIGNGVQIVFLLIIVW